MSVLKKAKTMLYGIIDFPLWFEWRRFFGAQALQALKAARYGSGCQISLNWRVSKRSIVSVFKSKQISRLDVEGERKVFEIRCFGLVLTFFPKSIAFWVTPTLCASAFCERKFSSLSSLILLLKISIPNILVETYLKSLDKVEFYYYYKFILIFS